ncbi:integrase family protein [Parascardovia denticolens IPLA 20019]|uniref:tyrosine-type recombinase/integrase n=1 Tax=Parascardovia denticolens TaxID=78258 RepID=UPI000266BAD8|nr:tyrosine-type recombinase/integrase [Parascardovia denticolens]EIT89030.1 integrase family protein [Parascardovia denticolens IPLA 20019]
MAQRRKKATAAYTKPHTTTVRNGARHGGKTAKKHRTYGNTESEALDKKTKLIARLGSPIIAPTKPRRNTVGTAQNPTLPQVMERWLTHDKNLGETSRGKYRRNLERHIFPYIGTLPIRKVKKAQIEATFDRLEAKKIGNSAAWHTWKTLKTLFNYALKNDIVKSNPMNAMDAPKRENHIAVLDETFIDEHTNTVMGIIAWIREEENPWHRYYPLVMAMNLGLRRAEVLGITREALDSGQEKLTVSTQLKLRAGGSYLSGTKTGHSRAIPLPRAHLLALSEAYENGKNRAPLLAVEDGEGQVITHLHPLFIREDCKPYTYNDLRKIWDDIQTAYARHLSGDPTTTLTKEEHIRLHGNRHIAASILASQNVSLQMIQAILGHLTPAMTAHYSHVMNSAMKKTAEIWGEATEDETRVVGYVYGELAKANEDANASVQDSKNPAPTRRD